MKRLYDMSQAVAKAIHINLMSGLLTEQIWRFINAHAEDDETKTPDDLIAPYDFLADNIFANKYLQSLYDDQKEFLDKHIISVELEM